MNPLLLEIIRQCLRWLGVWLMTVGVPEWVANLTRNEDVIVGIAGFVAYLIADLGWVTTLPAKVRKWWAERKWRNAA